ncbi:SNF2 helicase-associated domain-containing protein [Bacillus sp. N9]
METILRDRKKQEKIYSLDRIPKRWSSFVPMIELEQDRWQRLFPWLSTELNEALAWEFLTEASSKLIALGIEILLPSWWEAMREANLMMKAKVKQTGTNYRPSFVGLNAMLDFDWRLSMNGAELSEEEFQTLINEQRRLVKIKGVG